MAEADVGRLEHDVAEIKADVTELKADVRGLGERMARLEGGFEQMTQQMANVESGQRWAIGLIVTSWMTLGTAVMGLYLKG